MISVINGTCLQSFGTQVSTTFSNKTVMLLTIMYVCTCNYSRVFTWWKISVLFLQSIKTYMTFLQIALFLEFLFKFLMLIFNMWLTLLTIIENLRFIFSYSKLYVSLIGYNCVAMISVYIRLCCYILRVFYALFICSNTI